MFRNIKTLIIGCLLIFAFLGGFTVINLNQKMVYAQSNTSGSSSTGGSSGTPIGNPSEQDTCNPSASNYDATQCGDIVNNYIDPIITFLGIGVGLVITISLVIAGIQYTVAGDNPQAMGAAKNRIVNSLIALIAFALMYALLGFLSPGIFKL